jgi:hypothetical protein
MTLYMAPVRQRTAGPEREEQSSNGQQGEAQNA